MRGGQVLRVATRGSKLALWQAHHVRDQLLASHSGLRVEIEVVRTKGDRILDVPLARIGDKALFTRELDEAILDGRADFAVHSLKDVPTRLPEGLAIVAIPPRASPEDVLIAPEGTVNDLQELRSGARVGTSSLRRKAQLKHQRPDLQILDIRGNVDTRLARVEAGEYDAIVLAAAGVERLGLGEHIAARLSSRVWLPAVGQGALAIVARSDDRGVADLLATLHDAITATCVEAERSFLRTLEGGCQVPIGALATIAQSVLRLDGFVSDLEGSVLLRDEEVGSPAEAIAIGEQLARKLIARGAGEVLARIRDEVTSPPVSAP